MTNLDMEFFEPEEKYGSIKATVHKSGKLGFSQGAAKLIDFEANKMFKIGRKKVDSGLNVDILYMIPVQHKDEMTFTALKAGGYYYLKTKRLLTQLGIDYRNESETVSFDIDEINDGANKYFKLVRRKKRESITEGI
jgi:hypothetical protein